MVVFIVVLVFDIVVLRHEGYRLFHSAIKHRDGVFVGLCEVVSMEYNRWDKLFVEGDVVNCDVCCMDDGEAT
jgi:hypothetical protein